MIQGRLKTDFYHTRGKLRGQKDLTKGVVGDTVNIIAVHDNVLIVENLRNGCRFSVKKEYVELNPTKNVN
jgi:hypothetical protein